MDRTVRCDRCRVGFADLGQFHTHIGDSMDHHVCPLCPARNDFETFTALQRHVDLVHFYCEPCRWFAPSSQGLRQHNASTHNICVTCGDYFANSHQLTVHAYRHRPRGVCCYCCRDTFSTVSAMYNHLESGNCVSGIGRAEIMQLATDYARSLAGDENPIFNCGECRRQFRRMCDLLQHSETRSCGGGYWGGSGNVGLLAQYIERNISRPRIPSPDGSNCNGDPGSANTDGRAIPSIVITNNSSQ